MRCLRHALEANKWRLMQKIKIKDEQVQQNVLFFLQVAALSAQVKQKRVESKKEAVVKYMAFVNRFNGEMFFIDLLPDPKLFKGKDWKSIEILCGFEPRKQAVFFEAVEKIKGVSSRMFSCEDLSPLAYRVMSETMQALNQMGHQLRRSKAIEKSLAAFARLHLKDHLQNREKDIITATWHPRTRWDAEVFLNQHPYRSFLFRKDEYADILEKALQKSLNKVITCYTLSFSSPEHKISDLTIVKDEGGWMIYDNDPKLEGKRYASVDAVLAQLREFCQNPLFV